LERRDKRELGAGSTTDEGIMLHLLNLLPLDFGHPFLGVRGPGETFKEAATGSISTKASCHFCLIPYNISSGDIFRIFRNFRKHFYKIMRWAI